MVSRHLASKGSLTVPTSDPATLVTWGYCSTQEAFRDSWGLQTLAHPGVAPHPERSSELVMVGPMDSLPILAPLLRSRPSAVCLCMQPRLKSSFLRSQLSSCGIWYQCAFLQNHTVLFFNISNSQRTESQCYPSMTGMADELLCQFSGPCCELKSSGATFSISTLSVRKSECALRSRCFSCVVCSGQEPGVWPVWRPSHITG